MSPDDFISIVDDPAADVGAQPCWKVLVVDDEPSVVAAVRYALDNVIVLGRCLVVTGVAGAREALALLERERDFAVALVDVVMETTDAGLRLVDTIRSELGLQKLRIVIHTGQPGYAPELDIIHRYDINDYRQKGELDRTRLITTVTTAVRAYHQLDMLETHRLGLEKIVEATGNIVAQPSLECFASGVLTQICLLGAATPDGVMVVRFRPNRGRDEAQPIVLAAAGRFSAFAGKPLEDLPDGTLQLLASAAIEPTDRVLCHGREASIRVQSTAGDDLLVYFAIARPLSDIDLGMLKLFASKVAIGFDKALLQEELSLMAFRDHLTGLPNIAGWQRILETVGPGSVALVRSQDYLIVLSLFGVDAAVEIIKAVANRLERHFPGKGRVARVGTDTFGVLMAPGERVEAALDAFREPLHLSSIEITPQILIGVAAEPGPARPNLDRALIAFGRTGPLDKFVTYSPGMEVILSSQFALWCEMSDALANDRIVLYLQPQVDLATGELIGAEALMRWRGRDGRIVPPSEFIELAESSGQIVQHGHRIAELAIAGLAQWRLQGRLPGISINVSPRQLAQPGVADSLGAIANRFGVPTSAVTVEVTESAFAADAGPSFEEIQRFVDLGFRLSIDDFGTGHSSLTRLANLPVAEVKLDRSLCSRIATEQRVSRLARLVVELGRDLGFSVLAEGIEREDQLAAALEAGCTLGQGYLFSRPVPAETFVGATAGRPR